MEQDFYRGRLNSHGVDVIVPDEPDRSVVHDVIYEELVRGVVRPESKRAYLEAIDRLVERGAAGIVAGCTEIELPVGPSDVDVPHFPTTKIHAITAVDRALSDD